MALHQKKTVIGATLAGVLAVGVAMYVFATGPAESEVLPQAATPAPAAAQASETEQPSPAAQASAPLRKQRTREQAAAALMALPELQAWSALLEKNSGGKTHGALIEYDPAPRKVKGKSYYQFSFVENSPEAALRWESFLASVSDDEILVEDTASDELLTLDQWRKQKQPAKRTGIDG